MWCCGYTACTPCASPGFYSGPKACPACSSTIAQEDVARDERTRQVVEVARREWQRWREVAVMEEEMERLREAVRCCRCGEECRKAVSLACCSCSSCRRCALAAIRADSRRCWGCGVVAAEALGTRVIAPSLLANNHLVRAGVDFLQQGQHLAKTAPFTIFLAITRRNLSKDSNTREVDGGCTTRSSLNGGWERMKESLPGESGQNRGKGQSRKTDKANLSDGSEKLKQAVKAVKAEKKKSEMKTNGQPPEHNSWSCNGQSAEQVCLGRPLGSRVLGGREGAPAYRTIRVPHTYNNILTVIATTRVPMDS